MGGTTPRQVALVGIREVAELECAEPASKQHSTRTCASVPASRFPPSSCSALLHDGV